MIFEFCTYDQEIVELTSILNTGGTTTDDNHVHKSVNLILRLVLEGSSLNAYITLSIVSIRRQRKVSYSP